MDLENTALTNKITINCGGTIFVTNKSTLLTYPYSMLARRFCNDNFCNDNFIDRNPKIFELVLDYYRDSKVIIPYNISVERIKLEFEFYCLPVDNFVILNIKNGWETVNTDIITVKAILDNVIRNKWFQKSMVNNLEFTWYIGKPITGFEYYNIFWNRNKIFGICIEYLNIEYNLKAVLYACSGVVNGIDNMYYYDKDNNFVKSKIDKTLKCNYGLTFIYN